MCAECEETTLTVQDLRNRVERGVALLDRVAAFASNESVNESVREQSKWAVDWRNKVDVHRLDIVDENHCVLGQLLEDEGGYWQMEHICEMVGVDDWNGSQYGFDFRFGDTVENVADRWSALQDIWVEVLQSV